MESRVVQGRVPLLVEDVKRPPLRAPLVRLSHIRTAEIPSVLITELVTLGLAFRIGCRSGGPINTRTDGDSFRELICYGVYVVTHVVQGRLPAKLILIFASLHQILNFFHDISLVLVNVDAIQRIISIVLLPEEALVAWHLPTRHVEILVGLQLADLRGRN